jgi:hypothetical protein
MSLHAKKTIFEEKILRMFKANFMIVLVQLATKLKQRKVLT